MEKKPNYDIEYSKLSNSASGQIALIHILKNNFPDRTTLPSFTPKPFNTFGHFYLFDNYVFLNIILYSISAIKQISKKYRWVKYVIGGGIIVSGIALTLFSYLFASENSYPLFLLAILILALAIYYFKSKYDDRLINEIKKFKVQLAGEILNNKNDLDYSKYLGEYSSLLESQKSNPNNSIPILILEKNAISEYLENKVEPFFPGHGTLQLNESFIFNRKSNNIPTLNYWEVLSRINNCLNDEISQRFEFAKISKTIIINAESISKNSPWLTDQVKPRLFYDGNLQDVFQIDPKATVKLYLKIDVLFPNFNTGICFFICPYISDNSMGWSISLTSIGPTTANLVNYQRFISDFNNDNDTNKFFHFDGGQFIDNYHLDYSKHLQSLSKKVHLNTRIEVNKPNNLEKLCKMNFQELFDLSKFSKSEKNILNQSVLWPGKDLIDLFNIRENYSWSFNEDLLNKPELLSYIGNYYDQISKILINLAEELDFDVSKYMDKEGKILVTAKNIANLYVGEVVNSYSKKEEQNQESK